MAAAAWDSFGIILGSFWDHFGISLASFWNHFAIIAAAGVVEVTRAVWEVPGEPFGAPFVFLGGPLGVLGLLKGFPGGSFGALLASGGDPWGAPGGAWGVPFVSGSLRGRFPGKSGKFWEPFWVYFGSLFGDFSSYSLALFFDRFFN